MRFKIVLLIFSFLLSSTVISAQPIRSQILAFCPVTKSFDFPVGAPNAQNYYNAQKFGKNHHLGDDWNGKGGGNTDFGDPVYAISDGIVSTSENLRGGWGNVIRIYHKLGIKGTEENPVYIESLYAHLNKRLVSTGKVIKRGMKIGTIGNANGIYLAHLHFEIRDVLDLPLGQGYSKDHSGYLDPTKFIQAHRKIK